MNGNNACDNSCYRVCKLWVFWAVCCAELLTCSAELPPQSSHSDRYSGSQVLSPRAKLNSMNCRTIPFVQFCLRQKCLTLIGKNWRKNLIFFMFWPCTMCAWLVLSKILVVYSGTCSSSCRSFASFTSPTQPQAAPHIHEIESWTSCRI